MVQYSFDANSSCQKKLYKAGIARLTSFVKGSQRDGNNWLECWALAPNIFFDVKVKTSRENHNQNIGSKCTKYIIETCNKSYDQSLY